MPENPLNLTISTKSIYSIFFIKFILVKIFANRQLASSVTSTITKKHTLIYWSKLVKFKRFRSTDAKTFFVKNHWSLGQDISKEKEANAIVNFVLNLNGMKTKKFH